MVGKLHYVLEKKLYRPDEILLLAFNKSAADELKTRIAGQLGVEEEILVSKQDGHRENGRTDCALIHKNLSAPSVRLGKRVVAARMERMATQNSPRDEKKGLGGAVIMDRLQGIG